VQLFAAEFGHPRQQFAFHCSTAAIYIMACPPRSTRQQSPAATTAPYPSPSPRARGALPYPGQHDHRDPADRGEQQIGSHASLPHARLPSPRGIPSAGAQRSALGAAAWTSVASGTTVAPGTASPLSRTPRGDHARSGKRLPTAPPGVGVHAHGLIAVAAQFLIALAAAIEPGAPRSISMLANLGDGAPDLASLAWRGVIPVGKAVWASGPG
jgi:hypothetical protein